MNNELSNNAYIMKPHQLTEGVVLRALKEEDNPRIQVVLVIDEYTNFDAINKNRGAIKEAWKYWEKFQGSYLNDKHDNNLNDLLAWRNQGIGWGSLGKILNYLGIALILQAYDERRELEEKNRRGEAKMPEGDKSFGNNLLDLCVPGGYTLSTLFLSFRYPIERFFQEINEGYKMIENQKLPWTLTTGPFTKDRVRRTIEYFQERIREGRIFLSEKRKPVNSLEFDEDMLYLKGYFSKTNALLEKHDPTNWKKDQRWISMRLIRIAERADKGENRLTALLKELGGCEKS